MKLGISIILTLLVIFSGCGKIEDDSAGTVEYENDTYEPSKNNTCYSDRENSAGCFGSDQFFGENRVSDGFWSVYGKSDNYKNYFDKYLFGFVFDSDGTLKQRQNTLEYYYSAIKVWGVNQDGSILNIDPGSTYKIKSQFTNFCYRVDIDSKEYKICFEEGIDTSMPSNASGYYGDNIAYGNYDYGNLDIVGKWSIDDVEVELFSDGNTSNGGIWGVSEDRKRITIDSNSYLVSRFPDNGCIVTFLMLNNYAEDKKTLCKL
jgi:hypothetical protein